MNFAISAEPPSINRIMPVITPNNFLLTSRGRVVYGLMTIEKYNDSINEYISDEFRQFLYGRKMNYNESDIEKVIFSLFFILRVEIVNFYKLNLIIGNEFKFLKLKNKSCSTPSVIKLAPTAVIDIRT